MPLSGFRVCVGYQFLGSGTKKVGFFPWVSGTRLHHYSKAKAEILLNHGANPSVRNDFHETPAHSAAKAGNLETLKLMVEHGGLSGILMGFNTRNAKRKYVITRAIWLLGVCPLDLFWFCSCRTTTFMGHINQSWFVFT